MKILVCISNVPDTTTKITFTENNTQFNSTGVQYIINPYDELALSKAIDLCEGGKGTVTVINVGEANTEPTIRKALAIGADDAIRVNASPINAYFVANQIANVAKEGKYDMVLFGRESIDYNGSQVCAMVGELLDIPSISIVKKLTLDGSKAILEREIEGGKEVIETSLPFAASCSEGVAEPKIPNMRGIMSARTKPLSVVEGIEIPKVIEVVNYETPAPRGSVKMIDSTTPEALIDALHNDAKVI